ncbi:MAG: sigma 54-interacting transcriptional regulator [Desulfovibrionaceae bacterium]|nr:sigma 54-interacting transcriptional regulator [Desulfovibrionaceae bacterium]
MLFLTPLATLVFSAVQELGGGYSQKCLHHLFEESESAIRAALDELHAANVVIVEGSGDRARYAVAPAFAGISFTLANPGEALPVGLPPSLHAAPRNFALCLALKRQGEILEACAGLLECMDRYLERSQSTAAVACLALVIRYLQGWAEFNAASPEARRFLELALAAGDASMYLTKHLSLMLKLTGTARNVALSLGDSRTETLLNLVEVCLENMHAECSTARLQELRRHWARTLAGFDDPDITAHSQYFLGMFHFWEGEFQKVISYFDNASSHPQMWRGRFQTEMYPLYTSSSAVYLGRFHQAVGILESARRAASLRKNRFQTMWWEAQLAMCLLYMNRCEEALELVDHVIAETDPESETKIFVWGMRGLAYYHWRKGRVAAAHAILTDAMRISQRNTLNRPIYSYPWLLDMLHSFRRLGLPPVPGLSLGEELSRTLQGPNRHLQASAFRTIAAVQLEQGASLEATLSCLHQSGQLFESVGNRLEAARTKWRIADCLDAMGSLENAGLFRTEAAQTLADFAQHEESAACLANRPTSVHDFSWVNCESPPLFSDAEAETVFRMPSLFLRDAADAPDMTGLSAPPPMEQEPVESCRLALESLPPWISLQQYLNQAVRIACSELGAERAALVRLASGDSMEIKAVSNITGAELETGALASRLADIRPRLRDAPLLINEEGAVSLSLLLQAGQDESWLLYLESAYAVHALQSLGIQKQKEAARVFSQELRAALRYTDRPAPPKVEREYAQTKHFQETPESLVYSSPAMRQLISRSRQVALTDAPILILGETGVGKELLAQYIHNCSDRPGPFVPVHPASIAENLFESEFFGHEKGAFTGAHKQKIGLAELAHNGTLFIDEVGDIPMATQVKLLRIFQDRRFFRVGGSVAMHSDFRLVGATNKDLWQETLAGRFREDLYYRMSVVPLNLPPLRERKEDIPILLELFLDRFARRYHKTVPRPKAHELAAFAAYSWPGNVRELKSVVERAVILYRGGEMDYGPAPAKTAKTMAVNVSAAGLQDLASDLPSLEELERRYVKHVMQVTGGKITGPGGALKILGVKRSTFYARMKRDGD